MRALRLVGDRNLELAEIDNPPPPGPGEVQVRTRAIALNHIDVWGWRGMAFAKRKLPLVVGAEAAGEIVALGDGVTGFKAGDAVAGKTTHRIVGGPAGARVGVRRYSIVDAVEERPGRFTPGSELDLPPAAGRQGA